MKKPPFDLAGLLLLCLAVALFAGAITLEYLVLRHPSRQVPASVVVEGPVEVPIFRRDTMCPPAELRGEPEPTLTLPEDDAMSVIETELKSFANLVAAMRSKQRGQTKADIADAQALEREVDARVREIRGEPAKATVQEGAEPR